jgi:PPM family protein phosphatase
LQHGTARSCTTFRGEFYSIVTLGSTRSVGANRLDGGQQMRLQVGARTDAGRVRSLNEDVFLLRPEQGLFLVCDGMGGCPAGEVASEMAARSILEYVNASDGSPADGADDGYLPRSRRLRSAVERSNHEIFERAQVEPERAGMGTTVVGASIQGPLVSVAHVGDSRAYLWHHERLERLTEDHSFRGASGARNVLVRALGVEPTVDVDLRELAVQPGDYMLLCSDGLTNTVDDQTLCRTISTLRDPQQICDDLVDQANRNGGPDNITVIVVYLAGSVWRSLWAHVSRRLPGGHRAAADSAS